MLYVRVSLMQPRPGHEHAVAEVMDDLVSFYAKQAGYITGYKIRSADDLGDLGRITVWTSQQEAEATAGMTHVMSRRAALNELIEEDSHAERSYFAEDESHLLSRLVQNLGL